MSLAEQAGGSDGRIYRAPKPIFTPKSRRCIEAAVARASLTRRTRGLACLGSANPKLRTSNEPWQDAAGLLPTDVAQAVHSVLEKLAQQMTLKAERTEYIRRRLADLLNDLGFIRSIQTFLTYKS